jgi:hypothetical protein
LAREHPDGHLPDLARSLNTQSTLFSQVGRADLGIEPISEAVTIYQGLAQEHPDGHLPDLAASLNNQSNRFAEVGRADLGIEPISEAVTIYRGLAQEHPDGHLRDLARSLNNQSTRFAEVGRADLGIEPISEAVSIYRGLAQEHPDGHLRDLAGSLNNQSNRFSQVGRADLGVEPRAEALGLVRTSPRAARPGWTTSRVVERGLVGGQDLGAVVELLESARGMDHSLAVSRRDPRRRHLLRAIDPTLSAQWDNAVATADAARQQRDSVLSHQAAARLRELVGPIRALPGLAEFAQPPRPADGWSTLGPTTMALYLVACDPDGFVIAVSRDGPQRSGPLPLGRATARELDRIVRTWSGHDADPDTMRRELTDMVPRLGEMLSEHLDALGTEVDELVLIPDGRLASLPWHAALLSDGTWLAERYRLRYAPTLASLAPLALVDATGAVVIATADDLWASHQEANWAIATRGALGIGRGSHPEGVLDHLAEADWVLFTCHGHAGPTPDTSVLDLGAEPLPASRIGNLPVRQRSEAILSACSCGLADDIDPDQTTGFVPTLLSVGFARVLSCPWPVRDIPAAVLSIRYQTERITNPDHPASRSLQAAQQFLRHSTPAQIAAWLTGTHETLTDLATLIANTYNTPTPFSHPADWAGIILTGR